MAVIIQLIVASAAIGFVYALVALGINLIWSCVSAVNFAQGGLTMLGAYILVTYYAILHVNLLLSMVLTLITMAAIGVIFGRLVYWPLREKSQINFLIAAIGTSILLVEFANRAWGNFPWSVPSLFPNLSTFGSIVVDSQYILICVVAMIFLAAQSYFVKKTYYGKMLRATALDKQTAALVGINTSLMITGTFAYSTLLAGLAGSFVAPLYFVTPALSAVLLKGFAAAIIGGFGKVEGAVYGGLLVGFAETFGSFYISSSYRDAWAFLVLIGFLLFRPQGFFGREEVAI